MSFLHFRILKHAPGPFLGDTAFSPGIPCRFHLMKNVLFARRMLWSTLLGILLCVAARADEVTANFTNGRGDGVWEVDYFTNGTATLADDMPANWSTLGVSGSGPLDCFPHK